MPACACGPWQNGGAVIVLSRHSPYSLAFRLAAEHGAIAGTHIPVVPAPIPEHALAKLHPEERVLALSFDGYRQVQFVGGRLALGAALRDLSRPRAAVLADAYGAPVLPDGLTGSVSHKRDLAVAIAAPGRHGLGIDIEDTRRVRPGIAPHVLCADELRSLEDLDEKRLWLELITRFSIKEAVYKAVHRFVRRHIGFHEVAVWPDEHGHARVELRFEHCGGFRIDATFTLFAHRVLAVVAAHQV
jgi:enterobactin synthetase component D